MSEAEAMERTSDLPDRRALAFPDEPFSAYCKVCWQCVYPLWIDENDHHRGECMFGHTAATDCKHAMDWERFKGSIRKYIKDYDRAASTTKEG